MQGLIRCLILATSLAIPSLSRGWDTEDGAAGPQLAGRLPDHVRIHQIDVTLQGRAVSLIYSGENYGKGPRQMVLSRFSPPFGWQGIASDYPDLHFPELQLLFNGQLVKPSRKDWAFFEGEDVTLALRRANIDPLRVALAEEALIEPLSLQTKAIKRLFSTGADLAYPLWEVIDSQTWRLPQIPAKSFTIQVSYVTRPAKREVNTDSKGFAASIMSHCGNQKAIEGILKDAKGTLPSAVIIETVSIPLSIANMPPVSAFLTTTQESMHSSGLRLVTTLACGPEETTLMGTSTMQRSKVETSSSLSILRILAPT